MSVLEVVPFENTAKARTEYAETRSKLWALTVKNCIPAYQ